MILRELFAAAWFLDVLLITTAGLGGDAFAQSAAVGEQDSLAAWGKISVVLTHPRCLNCHQLNTPLQGDTRRIHFPRSFAAPTIRAPARCGAITVTATPAITSIRASRVRR